MRRGHRGIWGCAAIIAGLIIILSLVLPEAFWWFIFAAVLAFIIFGIFRGDYIASDFIYKQF